MVGRINITAADESLQQHRKHTTVYLLVTTLSLMSALPNAFLMQAPKDRCDR